MSSNYYNAPYGVPAVIHGGNVISSTLTPASVYGDSAVRDRTLEAPPRRCNDIFWAILFNLHLAAVVCVGFLFFPDAMDIVAESAAQQNATMDDAAYGVEEGGGRALKVLRMLQEEADDGEDASLDPHAVLVILGISGVIGLFISTFALSFMMCFGEALIKLSLFFNMLLFGALTVLAAFAGALPIALLCGIMCIFSIYYTCNVWQRIPFAASNLVTAVSAVKSNIGLAFYAYGSVIVLFLWTIIWAVSSIATLIVLSNCQESEEDDDVVCYPEISAGVFFLFLLSYYWTAQVISNIVHVTVAGTVGTFWFVPDEAHSCCSSAVGDSFFRSITTSFGSICLGSLLVAIIQACKEMAHNARENGESLFACCADCLLGCIEDIIEYFNKWAFVYVGIYGLSFMEAGHSVMDLFRQRGWTNIITDMLVDTVLFMVSVGVGALTGLLAVIIQRSMQPDDPDMLGVTFVVGFVVGYGVCAPLFSVVSSAVNTVIVCYAEAPNEFQENHPELSNQMRASWRQAWPADFGY